jgi:hypothetical protein
MLASVFLAARALIEKQHGLITARQATEGGLTSADIERLVARGDWLRLRRGVYVEADVWQALDPYRGQPLMRVRAVQLSLRSSFVFSHDSAALAHDMGIPDSSRALVHVTRRKVHGDRVRAGVKHHLAPYAPGQVSQAAGLAVLDVPRTALDMAREHGVMAGVAACDQALRRGHTRAQLRQLAAEMYCWPESRTMRTAIDLADPGAESYLESEGRVVVAALGIGRAETQFGLRAHGRTVWCDFRVGRHVFEVDGRMKYLPVNPSRRDPTEVLWREKQRHDFIRGFDLGVSRITHHDCHAGRHEAERRLLREFQQTCDRYGMSIADLAPYVVRGRR